MSTDIGPTTSIPLSDATASLPEDPVILQQMIRELLDVLRQTQHGGTMVSVHFSARKNVLTLRQEWPISSQSPHPAHHALRPADPAPRSRGRNGHIME
jgi:hypothetical protein